jgi:hypothetical protein
MAETQKGKAVRKRTTKGGKPATRQGSAKPAARQGSAQGGSRPAGRASAKTTSGGASRRSGSNPTPRRQSNNARGAQQSSSAGAAARRNGLSTLDAVERARERLAVLLGRPVESVLGVDRDHGNWVVTAQVVELARVPNTTDVLGEYEAILDRRGEVVSYRRTHRYNRGHIDGEA